MVSPYGLNHARTDINCTIVNTSTGLLTILLHDNRTDCEDQYSNMNCIFKNDI